MTFGLCNLKYYREVFLEIKKYMEMREEGMEEETVVDLHAFFGFELAHLLKKKWWKDAKIQTFVQFLSCHSHFFITVFLFYFCIVINNILC